MKNYAAHNIKVFKKEMEAYGNDIANYIIAKISIVAQRMVELIDNNFTPIDVNNRPSGNGSFPVWTANLHDATGVGVYRDGALMKYVPTKQAKWRTTDGETKDIDGFEELQTALEDGAFEYGRGIWIVLFSAVPYAYKINTEGSSLGRGVGFFDQTSEGMLNEVLNGLAPLKVAVI